MAIDETQDRNAAPEPDALDALLGYDMDENIMRSVENDNQNTSSRTNGATADLDAGIEEEVKVRKARKPAPKLDEERILSDAGIPKLRRITKDRLKLKGKGHEFSDVTRILSLYQLWLDDLYPKAKFADGLAMIEKLGHTKRMQMMRRTWIDEGKPKDRVDADDIVFSREEEDAMRQTEQDGNQEQNGIPADNEDFGDGLFVKDNNADSNMLDDAPAEDDLDMLLAEESNPGPNAPGTTTNTHSKDELPDDLDALLAEEPAPSAAASAVPTKATQRNADDDFADEMEAMDDMW